MVKTAIFRQFLDRAVDTVLPPRCPLSGEIVDAQGMMAPESWLSLAFITDPFCEKCGIPFDFGMEEGGQCLSCIENPPIYGCARAPLRYDDVSRSLILGFKHGDKSYFVTAFMPIMRQAGRQILAQADMLVPVPLHPYRLIRRRYNQAAIIGDFLAKDTGLPHYPLALRRVRATPTQGHLNMEERAKNVRKAFALHPAYEDRIKGKRIVLVDDVFTTGATVGECTKVLLKGGAAQVDILTLARVVRQS